MTDIVGLSELRLLSRQRADMENSQFITDAEWRRMLNRSYAELYDLIVTSANSEDYFLKTGTITLVSGTQSYNLPSDFYKSRGIDLNSGSNTIPLRRYNFSERNTGALYSVASDMRYHLQANKIIFKPAPSSADTVSVHYVPSPRKFDEQTATAITRGITTNWAVPYTHTFKVGDTVRGLGFLSDDYNTDQTVTVTTATTVTTDLDSSSLSDPTVYGKLESRFDFYSGWDEYLIVATAISALIKEEADVTALFTIKQGIRDRIIADSEMRDLGEPTTVTDISNYEPYTNSSGTATSSGTAVTTLSDSNGTYTVTSTGGEITFADNEMTFFTISYSGGTTTITGT